MIKIIEQFLNFFRFFKRLDILANKNFSIILPDPVEKNLFFYLGFPSEVLIIKTPNDHPPISLINKLELSAVYEDKYLFLNLINSSQKSIIEEKEKKLYIMYKKKGHLINEIHLFN